MKERIRISLAFLAVLLLALSLTGCTAKAKKAYHLSRADRYYAAAQYGPAEIEYINVLRYDPGNPKAFGRLGLIYYDQGRLQRAMYFLNKGSQLSADDLELRLKLGFVQSLVGQFTQALAQANFVLQKRPLDEEAPSLLVEASISTKDAAAARQRLQAMAQNGDRAAIEVALGNLALREHDVAGAAAAYRKAQALDPKSAAADAGLGSVAWAEGNLKEAAAQFKAAADASPVRSPRRMQYVRFLFQTGDLAGARATLTEILKAVPDYVPAWMVLANMAATENKLDESGQWIDKVLALDTDNFDALLFQGGLELARKNPGQAVTDFQRMARLYPQVAQVHYQLAAADLAAGDTDQAADSLKRALELNPNYLEAMLLLARIQVNSGNSSPAIAALEQVRRQQPQLAEAQLLLADAYRQQGQVNEAVNIYRGLETQYPTNAQVLLLHGAALLQLKDPAGARAAFEHALALAPDYVTALEQLESLDIDDKNFAAATERINRQIAAHPQQVALRLLAAKLQMAQQKDDQAEATLVQAHDIDPADEGADLLLAQLYSDTGRIQKALPILNEALAKQPQNTTGLMLAATIYGANQDFKGAADAYEKLLKIDPKNSPALNNLAYIYSEYLNEPGRAYDLAQRARQLLPFDPDTADTLGWICFKKGDYQTALGLLQESAAAQQRAGRPANLEVQYHLGMAAYMTGNETVARAALQRVWQADPKSAGHDESRRCLAILEVDPAAADAATRAMLEKRTAEKPDDPVALNRLARIYQRDGSTDKAIASYEALVRADPKNLNALMNLIQLYSGKDIHKAYDLAKDANKVAPYDPTVSQMLGRVAFSVGDYHLSASVLQQALQNQPANGPLLFDYARAAYAIGQVADAQSAFQNALGQNPAAGPAAEARRVVDLIALAAAPAQAAAASANIAGELKSHPGDVPALMASAAASEYAGDSKAAEQACEKVLERYPDFTPAQSQLARLYIADPAKWDRAYLLATKAHEALPDDPAVTKVLGVILVLRGDYGHGENLLGQCATRLGNDPQVFFYLGTAEYRLKQRTESKASLQKALALKLSGPQADSAKQMLSDLK